MAKSKLIARLEALLTQAKAGDLTALSAAERVVLPVVPNGKYKCCYNCLWWRVPQPQGASASTTHEDRGFGPFDVCEDFKRRPPSVSHEFLQQLFQTPRVDLDAVELALQEHRYQEVNKLKRHMRTAMKTGDVFAIFEDKEGARATKQVKHVSSGRVTFTDDTSVHVSRVRRAMTANERARRGSKKPSISKHKKKHRVRRRARKHRE